MNCRNHVRTLRLGDDSGVVNTRFLRYPGAMINGCRPSVAHAIIAPWPFLSLPPNYTFPRCGQPLSFANASLDA